MFDENKFESPIPVMSYEPKFNSPRGRDLIKNSSEEYKKNPVGIIKPVRAVLKDLEYEGLDTHRYELIGEVGVGSMGVLYKGFDKVLGRSVAIKVLNPEMSTYDPEFELEAKVQANMVHPNIVRIHDFMLGRRLGKSETEFFLISEWMDPDEFPTLRSLIEKGQIGSPEFVQRVMSGLTNAVDFMSQKGLIHRDITPGNIFVGRDSVKISDFTAALWYKDDRKSRFLGTAPYMSPEGIRKAKQDVRSEIFSMGAILYEIASGKRSFHRSGDTVNKIYMRVLDDDPPKLAADKSLGNSDFNMRVGLDRVIATGLQKNPNDRYQTAWELGNAVKIALKPFIAPVNHSDDEPVSNEEISDLLPKKGIAL